VTLDDGQEGLVPPIRAIEAGATETVFTVSVKELALVQPPLLIVQVNVYEPGVAAVAVALGVFALGLKVTDPGPDDVHVPDPTEGALPPKPDDAVFGQTVLLPPFVEVVGGTIL
jgi:hypothetical protein